MKYALMIAGLLVMCVPEQAGFLRFALQGVFGLLMFISGVALALEEEKYA
jgi:uncharacterized membrane protein HdeD (DUF308 family)